MMSLLWKKIKSLVCCGEEEEPPIPIGSPFGFRRVEVDIPGLTDQERTMIKDQSVRTTYPINSGGTTTRSDCGVAHKKSLSDTIKSVTTTAISTVGAKSSGYSALANESSSIMQNLKSEDDESSHEMMQLLPRRAGALEVTNSTETATAGCEEEDGGRSILGMGTN